MKTNQDVIDREFLRKQISRQMKNNIIQMEHLVKSNKQEAMWLMVQLREYVSAVL